jgi:hypothetical protein
MTNISPALCLLGTLSAMMMPICHALGARAFSA